MVYEIVWSIMYGIFPLVMSMYHRSDVVEYALVWYFILPPEPECVC